MTCGCSAEEVRKYAFFCRGADPEVMLPGDEFPKQMAENVKQIKDTPKQPGVDEIRIPSERAMRERERRRREGIRWTGRWWSR